MNRLEDFLKVEKEGKTLAEQYIEEKFDSNNYIIIPDSRYFMKVIDKKSSNVFRIGQSLDEINVFGNGINQTFKQVKVMKNDGSYKNEFQLIKDN